MRDLGLTAAVLPPRKLEAYAERLARAGEACWAKTPAHRVADEIRRTLWEPRRAERAACLWHEPCPLESLLLMASYLGLDPCLQPQLMWLVDCALTPQMPPGWVRREGPTGESEPEPNPNPKPNPWL